MPAIPPAPTSATRSIAVSPIDCPGIYFPCAGIVPEGSRDLLPELRREGQGFVHEKHEMTRKVRRDRCMELHALPAGVFYFCGRKWGIGRKRKELSPRTV